MDNVSIISKEVKHSHILQALRLDMISYKEEYQLKAETCFSYYKKNKFIYIMALDTKSNQIVGYLNFSPITKKMYDILMLGEVYDVILSPKDIVKYIPNQDCWAYFSSIVVSPMYRQKGIASSLINEWQNIVCQLAKEKNIYFKGIIADAVSESGINILRKLGFKLIKGSAHDSQIMSIDLFSKDVKKTKYNERIVDLYEKRSF